MEIKDRQKALLIGATVALGLLIGDKVVFSPLVEGWKDRAQRIVDLRQKVADGDRDVKFQRSYLGRWDQMRTNALPENVSTAEGQMLKAFDRWERHSSIARLSIKPQWKQVEDDYMTLECRADYAGDIDRLAHFLYEVQKDTMGLKVDSVEISSRDDNGRQLSLGLQVSGLLLIPPPPTNAPAKL